MVDFSDFLEPDDEPPEEEGEAADLVALKSSLQALADAIASTNLAVINAVQGDDAAATARVQASVAALKRFHAAFAALNADADAGESADEDA
jgi:hypothetical protein